MDNHITNCKHLITSLNSNIRKHNEILEWFQGLCAALAELINDLASMKKALNDPNQSGGKESLMLFLTQLLSSLSLLINSFVKENELGIVLMEGRKFATKQITCCLDGISGIIADKKTLEDPAGNFIKWMDAALAKVAEINPFMKSDDSEGVYKEAKNLFEEVICHAMSIAQVALEQDCNMIKGSSQLVLEALDSLSKELGKNPNNPSMVNLFVEVCSDKLCNLEAKVNTAVIKLSLNVFHSYADSLNSIKSFCFDKANTNKFDDLDPLIVDFDLQLDRIMQIGLFAVSCSTCVNKSVKIRSCLASLEGLESELVPAFAAILYDHSMESKSFASLLEDHWLKQANLLKKLVFLIIDPFAFCQVIYEENKDIVENLYNKIKHKNNLELEHVKFFIANSEVLRDFFEVIQPEIEKPILENFRNCFKDFKTVLREVDCSSKILLNGQSEMESSKRVLKRCKILLNQIKMLWKCFAEEIPKENSFQKSETMESEGVKLENRFLDHFIDRGKQILKDRSVLYKNSLQSEVSNLHKAVDRTNTLKMRNGQMPLAKFVHLRKIGFASPKMGDGSIDLQITDILAELTTISTTFQ